MTYKQLVSQEITDMKDLKTNDFKYLLAKTHNAEHPNVPIYLVYEDNDNCKKRSSGLPVHSMKVPETTLMDVSVKCAR